MTFDLTAEEFGEWRNHPTTRRVMQHLADRRQRFAEAWASGQEMGPGDQSYAAALGDIINMDHAGIADFYKQPARAEADEE